jgi:hypothetical protein
LENNLYPNPDHAAMVNGTMDLKTGATIDRGLDIGGTLPPRACQMRIGGTKNGNDRGVQSIGHMDRTGITTNQKVETPEKRHALYKICFPQ